MRIEDLVDEKKADEQIRIDGLSVPVSALKKLQAEGYTDLKHLKRENTLSLWGKSASACFTPEEIRKRS